MFFIDHGNVDKCVAHHLIIISNLLKPLWTNNATELSLPIHK